MPSKPFQPVASFDFDVNRAERTQQVRFLVPLLATPAGRAWFLQRLDCPLTADEAERSQSFHLCFPLGDLFTADYYSCRKDPGLAEQFILYYNVLFGLPSGFGRENVWLTAPGKELRHPAARGQSGWHKAFLEQRVADTELYDMARRLVELLRTEADVVIFTDRHVVLVECKYRSRLLPEQYGRQQEMGAVLAKRLNRCFHFGLVVGGKQDVAHAKIQAPCVTWSEIEKWLVSCQTNRIDAIDSTG